MYYCYIDWVPEICPFLAAVKRGKKADDRGNGSRSGPILSYSLCPKSSVPVASAVRKPSPSMEPVNQAVLLIHQHD